MKRESKKQWALTIDPNLLKTWQQLRRKKDPDVMAQELKVSRPVIDRALGYGHVTMPDLVDKINAFFEARLRKEQEASARLNDLAAATS